jgi:hypothetical protein
MPVANQYVIWRSISELEFQALSVVWDEGGDAVMLGIIAGGDGVGRRAGG